MSGGPGAAGGAGNGERPPVGGSWGLLYIVVLAALAAEIVVMAWLTGAFR